MAGRPPIPIYLEVGARRTFAGAVDWPGWCRGGRDEAAAVQALADYFPRYRAALGPLGRGLVGPGGSDAFRKKEQLSGNTTTDMGTPGAIPAADLRPVAGAELQQLIAILRACWDTFDAVAASAQGARLATGPRGGGRSLEKIRAHMLDGDNAYLSALGAKLPKGEPVTPERLRAAFVDAVRDRAAGRVADFGPRGGARWPARYAVRRAAWHALDHAWEIEDRATV